jgi:hypothetical protein
VQPLLNGLHGYPRNSHGSCNLYKKKSAEALGIHMDPATCKKKIACIALEYFGIQMDLVTCTNRIAWIPVAFAKIKRGYGIPQEFIWILKPAQEGLRGHPGNPHGSRTLHKEDHAETPGIPMTAITCQRAWPEYLRNSHGSCYLHKEDCEDTRRIQMDSVTARTP